MIPGSPEWLSKITASKVAAILGVSPWDSPRSVWHSMKGQLPREPRTETQARGHYLEPAILAWWRDRHGVTSEQEYQLQPSYTLGNWAAATPDMAACHPEHDTVLVEAKSVADDSEWGDPGTDVIPAYYLCQTYWQMHVSGIHLCYVPIITGRLRFAEYVVEYDAEIGADLERRMRAFYDSLAADEPPELDDTVATYDAIRKAHPEIDAGEAVELTTDQAVQFLESITDRESCEARERLHRSQVLEQMGRAQYAVANGVRVARRQPNKTGVSFVPITKALPLLEEMDAAS